MAESEEFKRRIEQIVAQDYKVEFLGSQFDQIVHLLSTTKAEKIYTWIGNVVQNKIRPIVVASDKTYKAWIVKELLTFRYPFSV